MPLSRTAEDKSREDKVEEVVRGLKSTDAERPRGECADGVHAAGGVSTPQKKSIGRSPLAAHGCRRAARLFAPAVTGPKGAAAAAAAAAALLAAALCCCGLQSLPVGAASRGSVFQGRGSVYHTTFLLLYLTSRYAPPSLALPQNKP